MSLNVIDYNGFQLGCQFLQAASNGQYETVAELVESGVHVDIANFGRFVYYEGNDYRTPLQVAACNGHSDIVEFLINSNAALDVRDKFGLTPLHLAAENGHLECVELLLNAFCDPSPTISVMPGSATNPKADNTYIRGTTPLHLAAKNNHIDCVKILFFCGADFNSVDIRNRTPLLVAAEMGLSDCVLAQLKNALGKQILSIPDYAGNTPLHFAVKHGMVSCVAELLRHGSDVNHFNDFGFTPLHNAICNIQNADSFEIVKLLILEGYNTDINVRCRGDSWQTPLAQFIQLHNDKQNTLYDEGAFLEIASFLIRYGSTVDFVELKKGGIFFENELYKNEDNYDLVSCMIRTEAVLNLRDGPSQRMMPPDPRFRLPSMPREIQMMMFYEQMMLRDPQIGPRDPQMIPGDHQMIPGDPQMMPRDPQMMLRDPQMIPDDPQMMLDDPQIMPRDPQMMPRNPQMIPGDPQIMIGDPQMMPRDPQLMPLDPQLMPRDHRMMPRDPQMMPRDPFRIFRDHPRMLRLARDPHNDPDIVHPDDRRMRAHRRRQDTISRISRQFQRRHVMVQTQSEELEVARTPATDFVGEKLAWIESLTMQPRTLQHYCRCIIRKSLGRIRDVHKLSIPVPLQDYILLSRD